MTRVLILKTAALGDVLRTTSILPGLASRHPELDVTWVTAPAAVPLVERHPLVGRVEAVDPADAGAVAQLAARLGEGRWDRVLSFDDEEPLCALASGLDARALSGAYLDERGERRYTGDVAPWFDMGLLSVHGKEEADRLKVRNRRSHPAIFAEMLGLEMGRPELPLDEEPLAFAAAFAEREGLGAGGAVIGLNTGAGGRWRTKELSVERTVELARLLAQHLGGRPSFLVLGGAPEAARNAAILEGLRGLGSAVHAVDGRTDNPLPEFAALVSRCDLVVTSDSLALHVAIARGVRVVAFFAPTSAAEIELYGLGEKVASTSPDYCSYRPDADNASITPERLRDAALAALAR